MVKKLSKDMLENIKNYSQEIVTLKDFVTAVRQNIGMYIGSAGNKGYINMCREIIQNSIDELMKKSSPCTYVKVHFDERTNTLIVEDNGRGIPFNNIIRIFEDQHTSSNYTKKLGEYSSGLHGVGAKVTNALSEKFIVESYILGDARRVEFNEGYPWKKGEVQIPNTENKQGTRIEFTPSYEALGEIHISWKDIYDLIRLILPLSDIGSTIYFSAVDINGESLSQKMVNEDGVLTFLIDHVKTPLIKPIFLHKDTGEMKMDITFTYDSDDIDLDPCMFAFGNCCPTSAGYHIDGFKKGINQFFTNYMNKIYLGSTDKGKKNKVNIISNDVRMGLKSVVSVASLKPVFNGQAKEILSNQEMEPFVKDNVIKLLEQWSKENPSDLQKLCKFFKEMAQIRMSQDKEKVKIKANYSKGLDDLPDKYVAPKDRKGELFIVEGDSAGGNIRNNRAYSYQGYFPIRGKIPNAFNTTKEKFLNNKEISGIIAIIGGGYGKNFDIDKVKWEKIIFAADADADGYHISALLLRFFLLYMPGLIQAGRVYKSVPPLYGIPVKGKKMKYFTDKLDYITYLQKQFTASHNICKFDGTKIPQKELSKILYQNFDYTYELKKVSDAYSVDPLLIESVITLRDLSLKQLQKKLKKAYRFIDVRNENGIMVIDGVFNSKFQTLFFNQRFLDTCENVLEILDKNTDYVFNVDGNILSLYEMMKMFDSYSPSSLTRYKGLGEMSGEQLYESTISIENRTLIKYTIEDVKSEIEKIQYYEDNKIELLQTTKVTRFDLMS